MHATVQQHMLFDASASVWCMCSLLDHIQDIPGTLLVPFYEEICSLCLLLWDGDGSHEIFSVFYEEICSLCLLLCLGWGSSGLSIVRICWTGSGWLKVFIDDGRRSVDILHPAIFMRTAAYKICWRVLLQHKEQFLRLEENQSDFWSLELKQTPLCAKDQRLQNLKLWSWVVKELMIDRCEL